MARQTLTKTVVPGPKPLTAATLVTWTAGDASNKEQAYLTERDVFLVWNTHASNAYTFTVTGVADQLGRTADIGATSLAAGAMRCFRPGYEGFGQTGGLIYMEVENAAVKWAILTGI